MQWRIEQEIKGRIDQLLAERTGYSRSRIQKALKEEKILCNGKPVIAKYHPKCGDLLTWDEEELEEQPILPEPIPLGILYEDESILCIQKPAGMIVHPTTSVRSGTLVNALLYHCEESLPCEDALRPGIVHRLDADTSGVMVIAKQWQAFDSLKKQFQEHSIYKRYLCIVEGQWTLPAEITINEPIGRHPKHRECMTITQAGKSAISKVKCLCAKQQMSLLSVEILTGRTHQIRVHVASKGYPIVGDRLYGKKRPSVCAPRQLLHARTLCFTHPMNGERCCFHADFDALWQEKIQSWFPEMRMMLEKA